MAAAEVAAKAFLPDATADLKNCFNLILNKNKLLLKRDQVQLILQNNLNIDRSKLNARLAFVLEDALVYYMKNWPGWQRSKQYFLGKLSYDDWLEKFVHYLTYKMNYIISEEDEFLKMVCPKKDDNRVTIGVQTDPLVKKEIAPYIIKVHGQPSVLNNLIFLQRDGKLYVLGI